MKGGFGKLVVLSLIAAIAMGACAPTTSVPPSTVVPAPTQAATSSVPTVEPPTKAPTVRVALFVNGTLGDKSWFDSNARGFNKAKQELGIQGDIIEAGYDPSKWQPGLEDAVASGYDLIFTSTYTMDDALKAVATAHPTQKFVHLDSNVALPNVYSVQFKQNEGSYLAGVLAALVCTSDMPYSNKKGIIGAVGGMDIPVINDFVAGYKQGAIDTDSKTQVLVQYAGSFNDPAKGKEMALAEYGQGACIVYQIAGGTGLGVLEASKDANAYSIGVDSDQALMLAEKDPVQVEHILTSVEKDAGAAVFMTIQQLLQGTVPFGTLGVLGLKEGVVHLSDNQYYEKNVPADIRVKVDEAQKNILSGKIVVATALK